MTGRDDEGGGGRGPWRVLRHRNYALVASGNFVNQLGQWARIIGIGWAAQELTDSAALVAIAFGAQFLPNLLLGPVSGMAADRFDRRRVAIVGNLGMAVPTAAIALLLQTDQLTVWTLTGLALAGGIVQTFTNPATQALIPHLVPLDEVGAAVALNSALSNVSRFVGGTAVGWAIAAFGTSTAFAFNTLTFLVVVGTWLAVRLEVLPRTTDSTPFGQRMAEGIRFARGHRNVRSLLLLNAVITLGIVQQPLLPILTREVLDADASAYGLLNSATGLGAIAGALVAGRADADARRRAVTALAVLLVGGSVAVIGLSTWLVLSVALQAVFGFGYFLLMTVTMTAITLATPDRVLGRVMGLLSMSIAGLVPVNALLAGVVASWIGIQATITLAGILLLAHGAWFVARHLHAVDRVPAAEPDELPARSPAPDVALPPA
jgi:MFS family permease